MWVVLRGVVERRHPFDGVCGALCVLACVARAQCAQCFKAVNACVVPAFVADVEGVVAYFRDAFHRWKRVLAYEMPASVVSLAVCAWAIAS